MRRSRALWSDSSTPAAVTSNISEVRVAEHLHELDDVEVVHEGVGHLDEDRGKLLGGDHDFPSATCWPACSAIGLENHSTRHDIGSDIVQRSALGVGVCPQARHRLSEAGAELHLHHSLGLVDDERVLDGALEDAEGRTARATSECS